MSFGGVGQNIFYVQLFTCSINPVLVILDPEWIYLKWKRWSVQRRVARSEPLLQVEVNKVFIHKEFLL